MIAGGRPIQYGSDGPCTEGEPESFIRGLAGWPVAVSAKQVAMKHKSTSSSSKRKKAQLPRQRKIAEVVRVDL